MIRALIATVLGLTVTLFLFGFMAYLISGDSMRPEAAPDLPPIEITMDRQDSNAQQRQRVLPTPPEEPEQPPEIPQMDMDMDTSSADSFALNLPSANVAGGVSADLGGPGAFGGSGEAMPIVRIEPRYPADAARRRIEGYVIMGFTIDEVGGVTDIKVLEAEPRRVFDREAVQALSRWKYRPKVEDGSPVRQANQTVRLDFELAN
ncbi:energy transducer TonB [Ferrimonas marina]|uniref:Protein TonB n=1 Tax=Ferrimonas marina TaxID=299255 RepID=A0A1M5YSF9_9GAMM|nr:energy transducer TonB [Ferrimonas marina]SHI14800.1 protein TonB [Ferrimonas marina]